MSFCRPFVNYILLSTVGVTVYFICAAFCNGKTVFQCCDLSEFFFTLRNIATSSDVNALDLVEGNKKSLVRKYSLIFAIFLNLTHYFSLQDCANIFNPQYPLFSPSKMSL